MGLGGKWKKGGGMGGKGDEKSRLDLVHRSLYFTY